jgi:hypothetical protein
MIGRRCEQFDAPEVSFAIRAASRHDPARQAAEASIGSLELRDRALCETHLRESDSPPATPGSGVENGCHKSRPKAKRAHARAATA